MSARHLIPAAALAVAAAAATASTVHLYELSVAAGAGWLSAVTPIAVDGLAIVSSVSLWTARRSGATPPGFAVAGLALALLASAAGNALWPFLDVIDARAWPVIAAVVALYPVLALFVAAELALSTLGRSVPAPDESPNAAPSPTASPSATPIEAPDTADATPVEAPDTAPSPTASPSTAPTESPDAEPVESPDTPSLVVESPDTAPSTSPVEKLARLLAERPNAPSTELAPLVGRSPSWVRWKRAELRREDGLFPVAA